MEVELKELAKCEICQSKEVDELVFGEFMVQRQLHVHYYCLLLSTNLPQRGNDSSGILGFLLRDIRDEAAAAKRRKCCYCTKPSASIQCHGCSAYFHLKCGHHNHGVFEFTGMYHSYCDACAPKDEYQRELVAHPPEERICDICLVPIYMFKMFNITYGDCCRRGFAHKSCMRRYALMSGYYLRCIWCRAESFRDSIRKQSVFVPDRDAMWEKQPNAYRELHERNLRCDEVKCLSQNGRFYNKSTWLILSCKLCGCTGAHSKCLAGSVRLAKGTEPTEFKCSTCQELERNIAERPARDLDASAVGAAAEDHVNASFYVKKIGPAVANLPVTQAPVFSEEDDCEMSSSSCSSYITVIASQPKEKATKETPTPNVEVSIIEILDSTQPQDGNQITEGVNKETSVIEISDSTQSQDANQTTEPEIMIYKPPQPQSLTMISDLSQADNTTNIIDSSQQQPVNEIPESQPQDGLKEDPNTLLVLQESYRYADEPYYYLVIYEFDQGKCIGTCVLRFNEDDPRIQDKSQEALERVKIKPEDVWCRDKNTGIFGKVDEFLKKFRSENVNVNVNY
ncbi:pineapple eye protein [Drosophila takahashii]|uniref:pineapple eye protein n=1 Tax=Drosophila takahashii TaxID=29030 RepID=UPI001CF8B41E|nr:uncharacterized protein LOC108062044 [Drosophila takahashii]